MQDSSTFSHAGPGRLNQLGGAYINGKPLPKEIRNEILALALQGFRPCDISRRLRITHGCISKLLSKYRTTGSIQAGGESAGRPRVITPRIAQRIMEYRKEQPGLFSWEIRDRLVQENLCSKESPPSLSSISRLLKNKHNLDTAQGIIRKRNSNSYMIASILNLPSSQSSSSIPPSMSSTSIDSRGKMVEQKQTENTQDAEDSRETFPLRIQRRERIKYTSHQLHELETAFKINQYPSVSGREQLARKIGVTESRIQVWFSNRRAKCKARRHSTNEADSRTNDPKDCSCRRISDSHVLPKMMGPGTSRIFFPPEQH
ncbi:paired box protein Pax-3-B-like [Orbicella faveolata]|uniref:paired box protein Pax-3-B-like n=1 Tax=Orbicella faveolata TaxID=48498 RepID=UPI0009E33BD1|nr:paired box protein Pax-3-B-like [Orbicella faveolata]XP_020625857.1 paired box protein Pax-3-B-like [Orbicella faveolata]XP_020625858.1 paired box protein Pax-3-B-like [Orbicella faveolata]